MEAHKRNEQAIQEIQHDISANDTIKAKLVLQDIFTYPAPVQKRLLFEITRAEDNFALPVLAFLWQMHPNIFSTYSGLYDIFMSKARHNVPLLLLHLTPREKSLPAYTWICGELRILEAADPLMDLLHKVTDQSAITSIIEALGRIADPRAVRPLAEFIQIRNSHLAEHAVTALGRIGTEQAMSHLDLALGHNENIDQLIVTTCGQLKTPAALSVLNRALQKAHPAIQEQAADIFFSLGSHGLSTLHNNLSQNFPDLQLRTLNILERIQDQQSLQPIRRLLNAHPEEKVRAAAYTALGGLTLSQGAYVLVSGLTDPSFSVRTAAARAADGNAGSIMLFGIQNLLHDEETQALLIVRTLFQARAEKLIAHLWDVPRFRELAVRAAQTCQACSTHKLLLSLSTEDIHPENR